MIAAFCTRELCDLVTSAIPRAPFYTLGEDHLAGALDRASCVVLAADSLDRCAGELQLLGEQLDRDRQFQLVVVTRLSSDNVNLLAGLRCATIVDVDEAPGRLASCVNDAAAQSIVPREIAGHGLLERYPLGRLTRRVVEEVLLSDTAVRDVSDLAARLGVSAHVLRRAWTRDVRPYSTVRLIGVIRWGRRLRAAELLSGGRSVVETAALLGVDESTIYRDLRGYLSKNGKHTTFDELIFEFAWEFALLDGSDPENPSPMSPSRACSELQDTCSELP